MYSPNIIVVGGVNVDTTFEVRVLPAEGQSVSATGSYTSIGGKGLNQALAARRAGVPVAIIGATGDDDGGQMIRNFLAAEDINTEFLLQVGGASTGRAFIVLDQDARNLIVGQSGARIHPEADLIQDITNAWGGWKGVDFVAANGETTSSFVREIFDAAREKEILRAWNPSPMPTDPAPLLRRTDILVLNQTEAIELTGVDRSPETLASELRAIGPREVVLTLGEEGCVLVNHETVHVPARAVQARDPTAAGDTFLGYYLASRSQGRTCREAAEIASAAASLCVQEKGAATTIPRRDSVVATLSA